MPEPRGRKPRPPLDEQRLQELALRYVGRFATTRAKLGQYLQRKVRERGWSGNGDPDLDRIVERLCELGYVDDREFALAKSRSLTARGYGEQRLRQSLRAAGVSEEDSAPARDLAGRAAVDSALGFARRRRLGPFRQSPAERPDRERALAAMVRAGHPFGLARAIVAMEPGTEPDSDGLAEMFDGGA